MGDIGPGTRRVALLSRTQHTGSGRNSPSGRHPSSLMQWQWSSGSWGSQLHPTPASLFRDPRRVYAKGTIREIVLPKGLDLDRPKRTRTSFTAEQLYRLEMEFQRCQYVVGRERTELARQLNLSETQERKERRKQIGSSVHWDYSDKSTRVDCHFLLQGIFPTRGWNPRLLHLLHWLGGFFTH
ncbi:hypothetical protein FD755_007839 [Muntiacus reevesi]|uniref:Homeobox domain-containing protein n=1 Tax=Muntiacus reevesi TaxID=9886 RepID=A0A5J5MI43_MUNRE|nr:hypothetical protein FD755_007839 [Muntiacus reevesi]